MNLNHYILIPGTFYMWTLFLSVGYMLSGELVLNSENIVLLMLRYLSALMMVVTFVNALQKYNPREKIFILLVLLLSLVVGLINGRYYEMLATCALVVGAKGEKFDNILKCFFTVGSFVCISMIMFAKLGIVKDTVALGEREDLLSESIARHSFGYAWPTDLATHVFFILFALWMLRKGRLNIIMSIAYIAISYFIIAYTGSRLGAGCILLLVVSSIFFLFCRQKKKKISIFYWLSIIWVPLLAGTIFILSIYYDSSEINWVVFDTLLSGRLHISQETIIDNGIYLFGNELEMYGGDSLSSYYNFIDSSYLQLFVLYGILYTVFFLMLFVGVSYKAYLRSDRVFLVGMLIAGLSGVIAQHFLQIYMNPLLIALTASHSNIYTQIQQEKEE